MVVTAPGLHTVSHQDPLEGFLLWSEVPSSFLSVHSNLLCHPLGTHFKVAELSLSIFYERKSQGRMTGSLSGV
jgi:hypothetical protein